MPDLEKQITEWRKQMLAAGIKTPVPLEELESHLRDEIEQMMKSGLTESASFTAAVQKIGQAPALQDEFKKLKKIRDTRIYLILCFAVFGLITLIACCWILPKIEDVPERMSGLGAVLTLNLLSWAGLLGYRFFPVVSFRCLCIIEIVGVSLATLWLWVLFYVILQRYDFTAPQLAVAILWGMTVPFGAFMGLMAGLTTAMRKKIVPTGSDS